MTAHPISSNKMAWYQTAGYWLIIGLMAIPIASPLFHWLAVPCTHDGHLHYHRIAAMKYALGNGVWLSRWLPDVAYGYGYPFFNYREALPLYLGLFPHLLGFPLPAALNLFYGLTILMAGWFMFLWVRDLFGPSAGLISALVYMAAPYVLIDSLIRGNQPESLAIAFLPLLCWVGRRFMLTGKGGYFVLSILVFSGFALSHNISVFLFTPFFFIYLIIVGRWREITWRIVALRVLVLFCLGLGLSSFYLMPALLELDQITIIQSVIRRGNDFRFNFASLAEIFAPVSPANPSLLNPPLLIRLGLVPVALAVLGLVSINWTRGKEQRGHIVFMALATLAWLFMALPLSGWLWEAIPLIDFVQFPWRFIGRAALPIAFLAGVPFGILFQSSHFAGWRFRWLLPIGLALVVAVLYIEAAPLLYPPVCEEEARPTINTVHEYEHNTGLVGVDPAGSYFPKTVSQPPLGSPLEADYQAGQVPKRFDFSSIPDGAIISSEEYDGLAAKATVTSPEAFQVRYLTFDFPGWSVAIDAEEIPVEASYPEGLIVFTVPAGEHSIQVWWRQTPLRKIAAIISLVSLVCVVVIGLVLFRKRTGQDSDANLWQVTDDAGNQDLVRAALIGAGIITLFWIVFKLVVIDQIETPVRKIMPPDVGHPANLTVAELGLSGFNLNQEEVNSGGKFDVDLAWQTLSPPSGDYQSNLWLVDTNGLLWSDKETARPRTYEDTVPTSQWQPGQWAWDSREVQIFPGTPPGIYDLALILFDRGTLQPLTIQGPDGVVIGPEAVIGQVIVSRPSVPPMFTPQEELSETVADLKLLGFSQDRKEVSSGELFLLSLFWEKLDTSEVGNENFTLALQDSNGGLVHSWSISPVRSDYPPSEWLVGERLLGQHALRLPAALESGQYQLVLEGIPLGQLTVNAPERLFEEPAHSQNIEVRFSDQIELIGMTAVPDQPTSESPITVTFVWQGLTDEMNTSYRVFVHLLDENGQIVDQSDAEPANWTRPTTGWVSGEYVVDPHELYIPAGINPDDLKIRVGIYDPITGTRLPVAGSDSILLSIWVSNTE